MLFYFKSSTVVLQEKLKNTLWVTMGMWESIILKQQQQKKKPHFVSLLVYSSVKSKEILDIKELCKLKNNQDTKTFKKSSNHS